MRITMSKLFIHGSGMLKRIPVSLGDWTWDSSHIWTSLLELGNRQPAFPQKEVGDYLVLELSYMVESRIVQREDGQIYTWNQKNIKEGLVSEKEEHLSLMTESTGAMKQEFDIYIQWITGQFDPEHIILVRTTCPDRCLSGAFFHRYSPKGKEEFQERCRFYEDYFLKQVPCITVDITKDYFADGNKMIYGLYVSYERLFYRNMKKIIKNILSGKSDKMCYEQPEYKLILQRYLKFYPAAYHRGEEDLLLESSCAVNCLVRALNPELIKKYQDGIINFEKLKCRDYRELLSRGDFGKYPELKNFIIVLQEIEEGIYSPDSLEVLKPFWGTGAGVERKLQNIIRAYYTEQKYLGRQFVNRKSCQTLYTAMVYALQDNYASACESIQTLLLAGKKRLFRQNPHSREDFHKLVSEFGQQSPVTSVDVWGNRMTKQIFLNGDADCHISHYIAVNMLNSSATQNKMEMLWSNSSAQLVFDIFWVADTVGREDITEESIRTNLDTFIRFAFDQYGKENLLFHEIRIKTTYENEKGEIVELPGASELQEKAKILEKYQLYLKEQYEIAALSPETDYPLCMPSEITTPGINYPHEYFDRAYGLLEIWLQERHAQMGKNRVHKNFVTAYPVLNLGDDLFIHMLADRYPEETFTLYVKNHRLKEVYSRYQNLDVYVYDSPSALKKCRNHIFIGGSMFIENVAWGIKYLNQCHVKKCAKKSFLLGANFGPYTQNEYPEKYRKLLETYQDVCFRESYSQKLLNLPKGRVAPDIVFGYQYPGSLQKTDRVVISVIQLKGRAALEEYKSDYDYQIATLCREFLEAGTEVVLMSFCRAEGDEQAIRDICAEMNEQETAQLRIHHYLGDNFQETMKLIAESRWIVGSRFHAVVLGLALEKTVYPVIYSDKTKHMLEELNFEGKYCQIFDIQKLTRDGVLDNEKHPVSTETVKQDAETQFRALDKLFGRKGRAS